jgi:tetratricopeptide (TPR) repeat protein
MVPAGGAVVQLELPRGMGGFLEKRRLESHRSHLERSLRHTIDDRIERVEQNVKAEPNNFRAQRELGQLTLLERNWQRAHAHLKRAYELNPDDFETQVDYALVLAERGQLQPAIEILTGTRQMYPHNPLVLLNIAIIGLRARRPKVTLEATEELETLCRQNPELSREYHDVMHTARGLAMLLQEEPAQARTLLEIAAHRSGGKLPAATPQTAGAVPVTMGGESDQGETPAMSYNAGADGRAPADDELAENAAPVPSAEELSEWETQSANADLLNNLAIAEAACGDYDKAVSRLMAALRMEPSNGRVLNNLGVLAYQQGRYEVAQKYLDIARQIDEFLEQPDPSILNNYGVMLSVRGDIDGGMEQFQNAGHHERAEFEVLYNLGRAYIEHGKPDKGVEFLRRAFAINPSHADVHVVLGAAYLLRGQQNLLPEALKHLKRSLQIDAQHRTALADLAMTLIAIENEEAAARILGQTLKNFPKSVEALFLAALLTMDEGDKEHWAAAGGQFLHTMDLRPEMMACLYNAALCQYLMGFQDSAAKQLQVVTERDPSFAPAYFLIGVGHAVGKRFDEALLAWQKAVKYEPDNPDLQANMGYIYYRRKQWDLAIKSFMAAHRLEPSDPDLLAALGIAFARAGMHNQAITAFHQSLNLRPQSPVTHSNLGLAYYLEKQVEKAMEHWRVVSQLDRDYADKRNEEQYRQFDDTQVSMRPLNWRKRTVKLAPALPLPHTRLLPGYNAETLQPLFTDESIQKLADQQRDLEQTTRRLGWMNVHVK